MGDVAVKVDSMIELQPYRRYGTRWVILAIVFLLQISCGLVSRCHIGRNHPMSR